MQKDMYIQYIYLHLCIYVYIYISIRHKSRRTSTDPLPSLRNRPPAIPLKFSVFLFPSESTHISEFCLYIHIHGCVCGCVYTERKGERWGREREREFISLNIMLLRMFGGFYMNGVELYIYFCN